MHFSIKTLFITIFTALEVAVAAGVEWQLLNFNLTLDNLGANDGDWFRSGELDFTLREKPTDRPTSCVVYWKERPSFATWKICTAQIFYRVRNISSSAPMDVSLDIAYMTQDDQFVQSLSIAISSLFYSVNFRL
jgi:hypothetical protein